MKKILFVTKSEMIGGIEKVLIEIANLLDKSKYEITVMTGEYNNEIKANLPKHVIYKSLFKKRFRGLDRILVHFPPTLLHKIFIKQYYDVEISFQEGYPTKIIAGANRKSKKICWFHNDPYYYDFNLPFFRNKNDLLDNLEKFDQIIAVSKFIAEGYKKYINLNKDIRVIYNPIDYNKINKLSRMHVNDLNNNNNNNIFRICYVGRLSEEKQVDMLVESVISLHKEVKNIELVIIGEGHKFNDIYNKVVHANAKNYIKFLGYKENPYPYIQKSSLLVCCSKTESFCLVVAESLALGTPVVSTKCGGPEEILENGRYGLLIENNLESLILGIKDMIKKRELYLTYKNFTKTNMEKFDKKFIISKIENILEESVYGKNSPV